MTGGFLPETPIDQAASRRPPEATAVTRAIRFSLVRIVAAVLAAPPVVAQT